MGLIFTQEYRALYKEHFLLELAVSFESKCGLTQPAASGQVTKPSSGEDEGLHHDLALWPELPEPQRDCEPCIVLGARRGTQS